MSDDLIKYMKSKDEEMREYMLKRLDEYQTDIYKIRLNRTEIQFLYKSNVLSEKEFNRRMSLNIRTLKTLIESSACCLRISRQYLPEESDSSE